MILFGWKRKFGGKVLKILLKNFEKNSKDNYDNLEEVDWLILVLKRKLICLEDGWVKSERLK